MSYCPQPSHSSRVLTYTLSPLAVLVTCIHYNKSISQRHYEVIIKFALGAYLIAIATRTIDQVGNGDDGVAVSISVTTSTDVRMEPGGLGLRLSTKIYLEKRTDYAYLATVGYLTVTFHQSIISHRG